MWFMGKVSACSRMSCTVLMLYCKGVDTGRVLGASVPPDFETLIYIYVYKQGLPASPGKSRQTQPTNDKLSYTKSLFISSFYSYSSCIRHKQMTSSLTTRGRWSVNKTQAWGAQKSAFWSIGQFNHQNG